MSSEIRCEALRTHVARRSLSNGLVLAPAASAAASRRRRPARARRREQRSAWPRRGRLRATRPAPTAPAARRRWCPSRRGATSARRRRVSPSASDRSPRRLHHRGWRRRSGQQRDVPLERIARGLPVAEPLGGRGQIQQRRRRHRQLGRGFPQRPQRGGACRRRPAARGRRAPARGSIPPRTTAVRSASSALRSATRSPASTAMRSHTSPSVA